MIDLSTSDFDFGGDGFGSAVDAVSTDNSAKTVTSVPAIVRPIPTCPIVSPEKELPQTVDRDTAGALSQRLPVDGSVTASVRFEL